MRIVFRGDSGFCPQRILNWCERAGVHYIVGLARNTRLQAQVEFAELWMKDEYERTGLKQRMVDEFKYAAQSWAHELPCAALQPVAHVAGRAGLRAD